MRDHEVNSHIYSAWMKENEKMKMKKNKEQGGKADGSIIMMTVR